MILRVTVLLLVLCINANAAPVITSADNAVDGQTIIITGTDFGATGSTIEIYDNFESGSDGANISTGANSATIDEWDSVGGGDGLSPPTYDNSFSVSGSLAMKSDFVLSSSSEALHTLAAGTDTIYLSYWVYLPSGNVWPQEPGGVLPNWKMAWIYQTDTNDADIVLPFGSDATSPYSTDWVISSNDAPDPPGYFTFSWTNGEWVRFQAYVYGTAVAGTSVYKLWVTDSSGTSNLVDYSGQQFDTGTDEFLEFTLGAYGRLTTAPDVSQPRFDDIYLAVGSSAQTRVEIGNASTYATSTILTVCTHTSWGDTEVQATVRQGSIPSGTVYLYVVDENGVVNTSGYETILGEIYLSTGSMPNIN